MHKTLWILLSATVTVPTVAMAREEIPGPVAAEVVRVIDGDTLLVEATPWPQQTIEVYVRIRGIDAPEMHSRCDATRKAALDARHALDELTSSSSHVQLTNITGDKYFGRIVANVVLSDGRNPAQNMLADGFANEYDGGRKPRFACKDLN